MSKRKLWTKEEEELLKLIFDGNTRETIVQRLSRTWLSIKGRAFKLGLRRKRKYYLMPEGVNHYFFDKWSNDMAYIMGFIAADGCITQSKKRLVIKLANKDRKHLENIRDIIAPKRNLAIERREGRSYVKLVVCSKYMCEKLITFGITPRKSLTLKFPDVPNKYRSHFIRGYFDGDGCITQDSKFGRWRSFLLGTKSFLDRSNDIISKETEIVIKNVYKAKNTKIYKLSYATSDSIKLGKWLYQNSTLHLDRKYNKFLQARNEFPNIKVAKPFTLEEDDFIINNFKVIKINDIAKKLNRSYDVIRKRAYHLVKRSD